MANPELIDVLKQGVNAWKEWIDKNPFKKIDLNEADLSKRNLSGVNLARADLIGANLSGTQLTRASLIHTTLWGTNLSGANLTKAILGAADLRGANLSGANLSGADLNKTYLIETNLTEANLSNADLTNAILVKTNLTKANMEHCQVYGTAVWDVKLEGAIQTNLVITLPDRPTITVDNLEVAQFIYLLLNNVRLGHIIDTITSKIVLILGRFTSKRKAVLDALRDEIRKHDYIPVVFDFDPPKSRNITETVTTLARMARFIIADITDPRSIPQELAFIVPDLSSVPIQPLLHARAREWEMFKDFKRFPWVLETYRYTTVDRLLATLKERVIEPAEQKAKVLEKR